MITEIEKEITDFTPTSLFEKIIDEYDRGVFYSKKSSNKKEDRQDLRLALGYAKQIKDEFLDDFCADENETKEKLFIIYICFRNQTKRNKESLSHESTITYENVAQIAEGIMKADIGSIENAPIIQTEIKKYFSDKEEDLYNKQKKQNLRSEPITSEIYDVDQLLTEAIETERDEILMRKAERRKEKQKMRGEG